MNNLFKETLQILKENGKTFDDVLWCGSYEESMSPETFKRIAELTEYDSGFGGPEVATDLMVVGRDFWLERHEYDGSEWWEYKGYPVKPKVEFTGIKFIGDSWATLKEQNQVGGKYGE